MKAGSSIVQLQQDCGIQLTGWKTGAEWYNDVLANTKKAAGNMFGCGGRGSCQTES